MALGGSWRLEQSWPDGAVAVINELRNGIRNLNISTVKLGSWDSGLLAFLMELISKAKQRDIALHLDLPESLKRLVDLTFAIESKAGASRIHRHVSLCERTGEYLFKLPASIKRTMVFAGEVVLGIVRFSTGKSAMRAKDLFEAMYECGIRSLPIVSITNLLFGLILAFVGAVQLKTFGAQVYVAGLVGIGMLRVMGAIMVGVVMSGRIGAAYAALIGTMQVNEEIDALETMGISPVDFLILPRMLALTFMVPLLTVFADLMGILGGFLVGISLLDLTPLEYLTATVQMVSFRQGLLGLVYATVFGIIIAIAGCYHGLRCGRSAQAVGEATTTAVVHSIIGIIVATAIITIIFNILSV